MKALVSGLKRCSQKLLLESVILVSIIIMIIIFKWHGQTRKILQRKHSPTRVNNFRIDVSAHVSGPSSGLDEGTETCAETSIQKLLTRVGECILCNNNNNDNNNNKNSNSNYDNINN